MRTNVLAASSKGIAPLAWPNRASRGPRLPESAATPADDSNSEAALLRARIEELNESLQQQVQQAFEAGLREGAAAAARDADHHIRAVVEKLAESIDAVAACRNDAIRDAEADVVRLSTGIARRVLHRELALGSTALEALIMAALEKLRSQDLCRVRIHPNQEQLLRVCLQRVGRNPDMEVIGDASLPPGGAVFEISRGFLDASIETQLREIERVLATQLGDRP